MKGLFITFEGVEGCGKSTQAQLLKTRLETMGRPVVLTREPGGAPLSEAIRALLLDPAYAGMSAIAELLLYEAARAQHVEKRIRPALDAGHIVLCDRFTDSTTAYQGAGRALELPLVEHLHSIATQGLWPDLTLVIDVPAEEGLRRAARVREQDRMEQEPITFHDAVRNGFLAIAAREPERVKIINGARPIREVAEAVNQWVDAFL